MQETCRTVEKNLEKRKDDLSNRIVVMADQVENSKSAEKFLNFTAENIGVRTYLRKSWLLRNV